MAVGRYAPDGFVPSFQPPDRTLGWQSLSQQADNELREHEESLTEVLLLKLEKRSDGMLTENPVPGAAFFLFAADGTQLSGRYVTDENGKISVSLEPGEYYFEESTPAPGFTFDTDATSQRIIRWPFTVTGEETEAVVVTAYNVRLQGALIIEKTVRNADGVRLSPMRKSSRSSLLPLRFPTAAPTNTRWTAANPQEIVSGGTLTLKHGQSAVFEQIPMGVLYTVAEQPVPGYTVTGTGHRGTITEAGSAAYFVNTYAPLRTGSLTVSKEVRGEGADLQKDLPLPPR